MKLVPFKQSKVTVKLLVCTTHTRTDGRMEMGRSRYVETHKLAGNVDTVPNNSLKGFGSRAPQLAYFERCCRVNCRWTSQLEGRLSPTAPEGLQAVLAGRCGNHSVGVFDRSDRTVMAAGSQTPKHNRRVDTGHHKGRVAKTVETNGSNAEGHGTSNLTRIPVYIFHGWSPSWRFSLPLLIALLIRLCSYWLWFLKPQLLVSLILLVSS